MTEYDTPRRAPVSDAENARDYAECVASVLRTPLPAFTELPVMILEDEQGRACGWLCREATEQAAVALTVGNHLPDREGAWPDLIIPVDPHRPLGGQIAVSLARAWTAR